MTRPTPISGSCAWPAGCPAYGVAYGTTAGTSTSGSIRAGMDQFDSLVETSSLRSRPTSRGSLPRRWNAPLPAPPGQGIADGMLGTAKPPYTSWTWRDLGVPIGGPQMILRPTAASSPASASTTRSPHFPGLGRPRGRHLPEFLSLPSGGDTSYPGLVWHDGLLWVSYYSSHEGKTSIYLAKVKLQLSRESQAAPRMPAPLSSASADLSALVFQFNQYKRNHLKEHDFPNRMRGPACNLVSRSAARPRVSRGS